MLLAPLCLPVYVACLVSSASSSQQEYQPARQPRHAATASSIDDRAHHPWPLQQQEEEQEGPRSDDIDGTVTPATRLLLLAEEAYHHGISTPIDLAVPAAIRQYYSNATDHSCTLRSDLPQELLLVVGASVSMGCYTVWPARMLGGVYEGMHIVQTNIPLLTCSGTQLGPGCVRCYQSA